jgi:hypothetical protein
MHAALAAALAQQDGAPVEKAAETAGFEATREPSDPLN